MAWCVSSAVCASPPRYGVLAGRACWWPEPGPVCVTDGREKQHEEYNRVRGG